MDIDRSAPATAEDETLIQADPETVFSVISVLDEWPSWNPDVKWVKPEGPIRPGTAFRWKAGPSTITSTLEEVERPRAIGWTGRTMGIRAVHVFRFEAQDGGTRAYSAESFDGLIPRMLRGYSRRTLEKGIRSILARLKAEAERRAPSQR